MEELSLRGAEALENTLYLQITGKYLKNAIVSAFINLLKLLSHNNRNYLNSTSCLREGPLHTSNH